MQCMFCNEISDPFRILKTTIPHCESCRFQWTYSFIERNCSRFLFRLFNKHHKKIIPDTSEVRILPALRLFTPNRDQEFPSIFFFSNDYKSYYPIDMKDESFDIDYFYRTLYAVLKVCKHYVIHTNRDTHTRSIILCYLQNSSPIVENHKNVSNYTMSTLPFDLIRLRCIRDITYQLLRSILRYYPHIHSRKRLTAMDLIRSRCYYTHGYWGGTLNINTT